MSEPNLDDLYIPWHNHKQSTHQISKGVVYLGYFQAFGEVWAKHKVWSWEKAHVPKTAWGKQILRSQTFQERALDSTLEGLKDCVVLSTTPSHFSQYQNACLLKSRGFELLEGSCYKHPNYPKDSTYAKEHPGIPDRYLHWEHVWWKVIGKPKEIGLPGGSGLGPCTVNNCGVDVAVGLAGVEAHDAGERKHILAVGYLPRGAVFPKGWKRFYSAEDYKLGHNFEARGAFRKLLSNVQECPHQFDLKIFEGWDPDFEKWVPS